MIPEAFKLAVISTEEIPDEYVIRLFLNLEVESEADIREAVGILERHRPNVTRTIETRILSGTTKE